VDHTTLGALFSIYLRVHSGKDKRPYSIINSILQKGSEEVQSPSATN
jgi:hypothetical protein